MIAYPKTFYKGFGMMAAFLVVFVLIFMPLFNGKNGLEYLDDLYNSISKGSAYYMDKLRGEVKPFEGQNVELTLETKSTDQAEKSARLIEESGASVTLQDKTLTVEGGLGALMLDCIDDSDLMYYNKGEELSEKYGYNEKEVVYNWWRLNKLIEKELQAQKSFEAALMLDRIQKRAVEASYNYYTIEPEKIGSKWGIVAFSLIFYVVYTLWYGFAIMYMFEGAGLRLEH